jgi:hypothetical protein
MPFEAMTSERLWPGQPSERVPRTAEQKAGSGAVPQSANSPRSCAHAPDTENAVNTTMTIAVGQLT